TCNGIDDNCNGTVDDNPTDVGGACGMNVGVCKAGVFACTNGQKICQGSVGPSAEICDGLDNNCNGAVDDMVTDAWAGQACCLTGNLADCTNSNNGTRCKQGTYQCVTGAKSC